MSEREGLVKDPENILAVVLALLLWYHHDVKFALIGLICAVFVVWAERNRSIWITVGLKILVVYVLLWQQITRVVLEHQNVSWVKYVLTVL